MNTKFFVVFALFVVCALAYREVPKAIQHICSINGTGTATVASVPGTHKVKMVRVRDTARYDIINSTNDEVFITILLRSSSSYFYRKDTGKCKQDTSLTLNFYESEGKDNEGLDVYAMEVLGPQGTRYMAAMYFDGDNLAKEFFNVSGTDVDVIIKYDSINYDYTREEDDNIFNMDSSQCPNVGYNVSAKTSSLCNFVSIPDNFCSFKAEGTATLGWNGVMVNVTMTRVKDYARYDFTANETLYGSIVMRADLRYCYFYQPKENKSVCKTYDIISMNDFEYERTINGYDIFSTMLSYHHSLYFDHETHELAKEDFILHYSSSTLYLRTTYSSWDHSYIHEDDDFFFSIENDACPQQVQEKAKYAQTSLMCSGEHTLKPKFPGCAFEFQMPKGGIIYSIKAMTKNDEIYYINMSNQYYYSALRCDIKNAKGSCLYSHRSGASCGEGYSSVENVLPLTEFTYLGEPKDVDCPDNTTGCKEYCDYGFDLNECRVINEKGYIVKLNGITLTYNETSPSIHDFEGRLCNGTDIPSPKDPCSSPASTSSNSHTSVPLSSSSFTFPSVITAIIVGLFMI